MERIFTSSQQKHGFTRKAHGKAAPARKSLYGGLTESKKNRSSVFSSTTEDQWVSDTRKLSRNAGFRN